MLKDCSRSSMAFSPPSDEMLKTVAKAVNSLLKWRAEKTMKSKPQILERDEFVYLILSLKKVPQKGVFRTKAYKIPLPVSLMNPNDDTCEICLIFDDGPKSSLSKDDIAKKIENDNIPVSKIIRVSKLKSDYHPFEAKRKLCDSYDMFFADKRIIPLLPTMLGKQFFKKKRIPVGVNLCHKNWKEQIENGCRSGLLFLTCGTCSVVKVGRVSMSGDEVVANVMAAVNGITDIIPKKWNGVRSFHLKLCDSLALPIYQALPDLILKIECVKEKEMVVPEVDKKEVAKGDNVVDRKVKMGGKKGRIREIKYIDNEVAIEKSKSNAVDESNVGDDNEDEKEQTSDKLAGKKRKKKGVDLDDKIDTVTKTKTEKKVKKLKRNEAKLKTVGDLKQHRRAKLAKNDSPILSQKIEQSPLNSTKTQLKNKKKKLPS